MRLLKLAFFYLLGLLVLMAAAAFLLPKEVAVSRSVVMNAPAAQIFPLVNDLRKFDTWSPWSKIDPDMKVTYSGADKGTGQKSSWSSDNPNVGSGTQEITESVANKRIETALDFGANGTAKAGFDFVPEGSGTKVTWRFTTDVGNNPVMRWMGLMFDGWVGAEYEKGLQSLKALAEKNAQSG